MQPIQLSSQWQDVWKFESVGKFTGKSDRRDILSIVHPWEESQTGDYAQITRRVEVPADWVGPRVLSFMAADNHHGQYFIPDEWLYTMDVDIFTGHRFSQILINDELVWEMDVAETDAPIEHQCSLITDNMKEIGLFWGPGIRRYPCERFGPDVQDPPPYVDVYRHVDISQYVAPGEAFDLTLRLYDKVGSATPLPGDLHGIMSEEPEDNRTRFQTIAWWADVTLLNEPLAQERSFADRIQLNPLSETPQVNTGSVEMEINRGDTLPAIPFPIWGGVPFPQGALQNPEGVRLTTADGNNIPVQTKTSSQWIGDGSVQWLDVNFVAPAGVKKVVLHYGAPAASASPFSSVIAKRDGVTVSINSGTIVLSVRAGSTALLESFQAIDGPQLGPIRGILNQQMLGEVYSHKTLVNNVDIEEYGPVRASIALRGQLVDDNGHCFGRFVARLRVWAGSPLLSLTFRIFQDMDEPVAIVHELLLEMDTPPLADIRGAFGEKWHGPLAPRRLEELELRQENPQAFKVTGAADLENGEHAPGWMGVQGIADTGETAGIACGIRWFWQQAPKTLTVTPDKITLGLFGKRRRIEWRIDDGPTSIMTCGEAKRHSVWLMPFTGEQSTELQQQVQTAWDARPHLLNPEWFASSNVLGNLAPFPGSNTPEMSQWLDQLVEFESSQETYGLRDWRDTLWCHNDRGRAANALQLHFASGRGEWQDYFEQVMHHNLDIDTIHCSPAHPEWVGALRGFGPYHTTNPPAAHIGSNCQDQYLHHFFTGEPDSREEAELAARWIARQSGNQDRSARYEGWPLAQMSIAYTWTGNDDFLRAAGEFLHFAELYTHPRRGGYDEVHGSFSHRGIVPFMTGYLGYGLIRYHQATGDERAAKLLIALSEAVADEASDGQGGYRYSPDPRLSEPHGYPPALNIGGMLAYSYRLTGDAWFAREAHLCYNRHRDLLLGHFTSLDMTQSLGELLSGIELARQRGDL